MSFYNNVRKHLCQYKKEKYPNLENGFWVRSKPPKELCYAFRPKDGDNNLISIFKKRFTEYEHSIEHKIKRHMYFHHMNSSQAMCINFFFPLLYEKKLELITQFFGFQKEIINYDSAAFEKISNIDCVDGNRPTNFDFFFETVSGKKFFFEIKYTERDFGKAKKDTNHTQKFNVVYKKHLNRVVKRHFQKMEIFFDNYQLLRNMIHINDNSYLILIYPKDNKKVRDLSEKAKNEIIIEKYKSHLFLTEWEGIFQYTKNQIFIHEILNQIDEFEKKYFIKSTDIL